MSEPTPSATRIMAAFGPSTAQPAPGAPEIHAAVANEEAVLDIDGFSLW